MYSMHYYSCKSTILDFTIVKSCDLIYHTNCNVKRGHLIDESLLYKKQWQSYEAINNNYMIKNLLLFKGVCFLCTAFYLGSKSTRNKMVVLSQKPLNGMLFMIVRMYKNWNLNYSIYRWLLLVLMYVAVSYTKRACLQIDRMWGQVKLNLSPSCDLYFRNWNLELRVTARCRKKLMVSFGKFCFDFIAT